MDGEPQKTLQWLGNQHFEEQRALRAAEDNLFNWATSLFLAGLGALTTLRGVTDAQWSITWRLLLIVAIIGIDGVILLMAYLIHLNYERNLLALAAVKRQLGQVGAVESVSASMDYTHGERYIFFLRWSIVGALGFIMMILIWLLG